MENTIREIYGVTGRPVLHSKSPGLFAQVFVAPYVRIAADTAREAFDTAVSIGLKGLNVTSPFKEDICNYIDDFEYPAGLLNSVNTVLFENGRTVGCNTDVIGFRNQLSGNGIVTARKKVLVLGSGGAASAAVLALTETGAIATVCSRNNKKAESIAKKLKIGSCHWMTLPKVATETDFIVNCLPRGINALDNLILNKSTQIIDANYYNGILYDYAENNGLKYVSGEQWLTGQALPAFELFIEEDIFHEIEFQSANNKIDIITLTGFMGSGKSVTGEILGRELGCRFYDIDSIIESKTGKPIAKIFKDDGEVSFRTAEAGIIKDTYRDIINSGIKAVVALGGGALMNEESRLIAENSSTVIWLYSSLKSCVERLNPGTRPLLDVDDPLGQAKRMFEDRAVVYAKASGLVVNTTFEPQRTSSKIIREINSVIQT